MRNIVNALFVRNGCVLLARRSPKRRIYPDVWSFPGGHVDEGETLAEALIRELNEEVGVVPITYVLMGTISDPNHLDGMDAPRRHRCAKVVVFSNHQERRPWARLAR